LRSILASLSPGQVFGNGVILVPLALYHDGATKTGRVITLTCIAATEQVWIDLQSKWDEMRKERGNPSYIHMTDLMANPPQRIYEGWSDGDREYLIDGLLSVLNSFMDNPWINSFTCEVDLAAHKRLIGIRNLPNPARICARVVFSKIVNWFYRPSSNVFVDAMDIFFDRGEPFSHHLRADWINPTMRKLHPVWNFVRVIEQVDMKLTPPIQMADLICWGYHRQSSYEKPEPWTYDHFGYTTAVRCANGLRGTHFGVREDALTRSRFKEEGPVLADLWRKQGELVTNPSEEYKKFDAMMRRLMHVPHSDIKAALDAEKAEKQEKKRKAKKPSALGRAGNDER
jgi:hypothetical protein